MRQHSPAFLSRSCLSRVYAETVLFREEYKAFACPGKSHGPDVGQPLFLHRPEATRAVLLIHGFMAAPEEVREWGEHFFSNGYTVYAPRLSGHGTSPDDLDARAYADWAASVSRGYNILSLCAKDIVVAGFSTGAGLALHEALCHPGRYLAVVSVSAPMKFAGWSASLTGIVEYWNRAVRLFHLHRLEKPFFRNHPDNPEINYHLCPVRGFNQVKRLMKTVYLRLPGLSVPALVVQGSGDPKVSPKAGKMLFHRITASHGKYVEIDYHQHGIVRGEIGKAVFRAVDEFLKDVL